MNYSILSLQMCVMGVWHRGVLLRLHNMIGIDWLLIARNRNGGTIGCSRCCGILRRKLLLLLLLIYVVVGRGSVEIVHLMLRRHLGLLGGGSLMRLGGAARNSVISHACSRLLRGGCRHLWLNFV